MNVAASRAEFVVQHGQPDDRAGVVPQRVHPDVTSEEGQPPVSRSSQECALQFSPGGTSTHPRSAGGLMKSVTTSARCRPAPLPD